jgi:4a-hydroxytetrahydrobiopterin dehydratase
MSYQEFVPNLIGMIGVLLVLLAYLSLQVQYWRSDSLIFSLSNLVGAICILFSLLFHWNLASIVIEIIWMLISSYRIICLLRGNYISRDKKKGLSAIDLRQERNRYFIPLKSIEIASFLQELGDNWEVVNDNHLKKTWVFSTYQKSIDFVNQVVIWAEKENHHPVFLIEYKKVTVTIWTHNINALTQADYVLASKISACSSTYAAH